MPAPKPPNHVRAKGYAIAMQTGLEGQLKNLADAYLELLREHLAVRAELRNTLGKLDDVLAELDAEEAARG